MAEEELDAFETFVDVSASSFRLFVERRLAKPGNICRQLGSEGTTKQLTDRHAVMFTCDVPKRDVDRGEGVQHEAALVTANVVDVVELIRNHRTLKGISAEKIRTDKMFQDGSSGFRE